MNALKAYQTLSRWPLGRWIFSWGTTWTAPYFSTIRPLVADLSATGCTIRFRKRRRVQNHLGTVHAIAMCNACELAFGLTMEAGLSRSLRWIPKAMTARYLKKANTDLEAICSFPELPRISAGDHPVYVKVVDKNGEVVMDATITVYVSPRK